MFGECALTDPPEREPGPGWRGGDSPRSGPGTSYNGTTPGANFTSAGASLPPDLSGEILRAHAGGLLVILGGIGPHVRLLGLLELRLPATMTMQPAHITKHARRIYAG